MDFLKPYSNLIALTSLLVSLVAAFVAGRATIKVERVRQQFALQQNRISILREFQSFIKEQFVAMDKVADGIRGATMSKEENLAIIAHMRAVNNRYREIAYAFSNESQDVIGRTLAFIENEAGTPQAIEQLTALPSLYRDRVTQDLGRLFQ